MAKVSISEAARLAGVSRGTMYKTYLNKGVVSLSTDAAGKKCVDTSELLRVFGSLRGDNNVQVKDEQVYTGEQAKALPIVTQKDAKDVEIRLLREQLEKSERREQWLQSQISTLSDTLKLLEHKPEPAKVARRWWEVWK